MDHSTALGYGNVRSGGLMVRLCLDSCLCSGMRKHAKGCTPTPGMAQEGVEKDACAPTTMIMSRIAARGSAILCKRK